MASILLRMPDWGFLDYTTPYNNPSVVPPIHTAPSIWRPFNIPDDWFTAMLDTKVPCTIAATYAITIILLNKYNRANGLKPWAISKTGIFKVFVVLHNVFLAIYSAWTFVAMVGALHRSVLSPMGPAGFAGTWDSICRAQGSAGFGNAIHYDEETSRWASDAIQNSAIGADGFPSKIQPGRLWTEGIAYYGWLFYLSKFYEVFDTLIILAKGKTSSTLQTYHHTGAMMCMWAGIRFMSAPIWVFLVFNSFIHAMMYTYYTVTAFKIKVPVIVKRTLTTCQITQFLIGGSLAASYAFISYNVPVTYLGKAAISNQSAYAAANGNSTTNSQASDDLYITQSCVPTRGENFAVWLNVIYLAPLTYLFVSFFIKSYIKRSNAGSKTTNGQANGKAQSKPDSVTIAEKAGWDAAKSVKKEVYGSDDANDSDNTPKKAAGGGRRRRG